MDTLVAAHLAHLRRLNRRPGSIYQRSRWLARLERAITPTLLVDATLEQLRAFTSSAGPSPATQRAAVSNVRGFYHWLIVEELRVDDPTRRLECPGVPDGLPRPMPDHHVAHALNSSPERLRPWYYFAAYAGLRACEIAQLRGEDFRGGIILIREQKGGDEGVVPRSPVLDQVLVGLPQRGWLFPKLGHGWGDDHVTAGQVSKLANKWLHEEGIDDTFHSLRHWFGTMSYRANGDLLAAQTVLRHRKLETTKIYTKLANDRAAATVASLPDLTMYATWVAA